MKIAFDSTTLILTQGGTSVYLNNLVSAMRKIAPGNEYSYFSTGTVRRQKIQVLRQISTLYRELIWQQFILPVSANKKKVDVLHCPAHLAPLYSKVPKVVTFHDIYILKDQKSFRYWQSTFAEFIYPKIISSNCKIIAISFFTKNELINKFKIADNKIDVVHQGVESRFKVITDDLKLSKIKRKYDLPNQFILYVGAIEPRKNLFRLIEALSLKGNKLPLVIVSSGGWKNEILLNNIQDKRNNISLLQNISDEELPYIYNLASLFVSPSLYEGFGLPLLEAMACGCPIVVSNCSAHLEITNGLAEYFDPTKIEDIAAKINATINSTEKLQSLKIKGLENAQLFSWEKCAQSTLEVYKSML